MKRTTYKQAINWLHPSLILCNNIATIDASIWDNIRFEFEDEDGNEIEIYQYFLTSFNDSDIEFLEKYFPSLLFTYSELLECYVLCVDHFGTSWDSVYIDTTLETI